MGVWEQIKRAKAAGQRVLEKYDGVEAEARASDPDRLARSLATGSTETRLSSTVSEDEKTPEVVVAGEILIEFDESNDVYDVPVEHEGEGALFSRQDDGGSMTDPVLETIEKWEVADRLFGQEFASNEVTDVGFELTEEGVPAVDIGLTDPNVYTDSGVVQDTTSDIVTNELTDPTCELFPTDSGLTATATGIELGAREIEQHLLRGRFGNLRGVSLGQMEELSRFDSKLLLHGENLGSAILELLLSYEASDGSISEQWESALWVTGVHWDVEVRENLEDLNTAENASERKISLRCLAWSVFDDIGEIYEAAGGVDDVFGLMSIYRKIVVTLSQRWDFLKGSGLSEHEDLVDDLPIEPTGILAVQGFEWGLRETN